MNEIEVRGPQPHIPPQAQQLGVTMRESGGQRAIIIPPELRQQANVLLPRSEITASDPNFTPAIRMVQLDVQAHTYEQGKDRALNKQGLEVLANCAGLLNQETGLISRDLLEPGQVGYWGSVDIRRSDGSIERIRRTRIVNVDLEREKIRDAVERWAQRNQKSDAQAQAEFRKRWLTEQEWIHSKAESKAVLRAIRAALHVPHVYTLQELRRPFLVVGYAFTPDMSDPEVRRAMLGYGLGQRDHAYGGARVSESHRIAPTDDIEVPVAIAEHAQAPEPASQPEPESGFTGAEPEPAPEPQPSSGVGATVVPWGRFKGRTLDEIGAVGRSEGGGESYIAWIAENSKDEALAMAAKVWLASYQEQV